MAFLTGCSCVANPLPAINSSSSSSSESKSIQGLVRHAEAAPIALPPEPTAASLSQLVQLHSCKHCDAFKPPAAGRVLELGCGTGASAVWLARQVRCAGNSSTPAAAAGPADRALIATCCAALRE
jgi:predicted O-methyltransferase YrrM